MGVLCIVPAEQTHRLEGLQNLLDLAELLRLRHLLGNSRLEHFLYLHLFLKLSQGLYIQVLRQVPPTCNDNNLDPENSKCRLT